MSNDCVIIGDIEKSREIDNWSNVFQKLLNILSKVNHSFSHTILVDFTATVGDEFQGAITTPEKVLDIYDLIRSELQEVGIYYGVGVGDVERPFSKEMGLRGSAFYRARDALEVCKKKKRRILFKFSDTPNPTGDLINASLRLIETLEKSWTERQREIAGYYRLHANYTYDQLGKHFGVSKQAVSQFLKATDWEVTTEMSNSVKMFLKHIYSSKEEVK